eukprot:3957530-Prymnesium_polylepis.1
MFCEARDIFRSCESGPTVSCLSSIRSVIPEPRPDPFLRTHTHTMPARRSMGAPTNAPSRPGGSGPASSLSRLATGTRQVAWHTVTLRPYTTSGHSTASQHGK